MTTTHFASEAVPNNPGPALAVIIGAKNVVSFVAFMIVSDHFSLPVSSTDAL
jgi:hypothetical protein